MATLTSRRSQTPQFYLLCASDPAAGGRAPAPGLEVCCGLPAAKKVSSAAPRHLPHPPPAGRFFPVHALPKLRCNTGDVLSRAWAGSATKTNKLILNLGSSTNRANFIYDLVQRIWFSETWQGYSGSVKSLKTWFCREEVSAGVVT